MNTIPSLWRRKVWLINPKFQLSFLAYVMATAFCVIAVFYCADLYFFHKLTTLGKTVGLPPQHVFFTFISQESHLMNRVFAVVGTCVFAMVSISGLLLSHRVAGPLYRFCKHLDAVAEGKTNSTVTFREKDYFQEVATAYNRVIETKDQKKNQIRAA